MVPLISGPAHKYYEYIKFTYSDIPRWSLIKKTNIGVPHPKESIKREGTPRVGLWKHYHTVVKYKMTKDLLKKVKNIYKYCT